MNQLTIKFKNSILKLVFNKHYIIIPIKFILSRFNFISLSLYFMFIIFKVLARFGFVKSLYY